VELSQVVADVELRYLAEGTLQHEADADDLHGAVGQPDDGPATEVVELPRLLRRWRLLRYALLQLGQRHRGGAEERVDRRRVDADAAEELRRKAQLLVLLGLHPQVGGHAEERVERAPGRLGLPARYRHRIVFRADGAGASKDLLAWIKTEAARCAYTWHYSVGFDITEPVRDAITAVPAEAPT
jgi:hypothetical protein